jgi:Outer membrane protein beta-barrel domain
MRPGPNPITLLLAAVTLATVCPAPVVAADSNDLNVEITPFVAYRTGGSFEVEASNASYRLDDSEAFGLIFNLRQTDKTQWEVLYSKQQTQARLRDSAGTAPSVNTDINVLQIGGTYQGDGDLVRPYLALTLGGTHIKTRSNGSRSDTFFSGSIGVGLNMMPGKRVGIRLEARAYGTLMSSNTDLFCETGPDANVCAIRIEGTILSQFEAFAGVIFRF